jgi:hypothetical protein
MIVKALHVRNFRSILDQRIDCDNAPRLQEPIRDPARLDWNEVTKVAHYYLAVNAMTKPMQVREDSSPYGGFQ